MSPKAVKNLLRTVLFHSPNQYALKTYYTAVGHREEKHWEDRGVDTGGGF